MSFRYWLHFCSIAQKKEGRLKHIIQIHLEVLQLGNCMISGHVQAFKNWDKMTTDDKMPMFSMVDSLCLKRRTTEGFEGGLPGLESASQTFPDSTCHLLIQTQKYRLTGWQVDSYIKSNKSIVHDIWTSFDAVAGESVLTWWVALQSHQIESPPTGWCPHPGEHKLMSLVLTKSRWAFPAFPSGIATLMPCSSKKASRHLQIASKSFTSSHFLAMCFDLFHFCVFHDKFLSCNTFSICFISFTVWALTLASSTVSFTFTFLAWNRRCSKWARNQNEHDS